MSLSLLAGGSRYRPRSCLIGRGRLQRPARRTPRTATATVVFGHGSVLGGAVSDRRSRLTRSV
eukprot:11071206-Heterocapsa_arctica.AAC.1